MFADESCIDVNALCLMFCWLLFTSAYIVIKQVGKSTTVLLMDLCMSCSYGLTPGSMAW